MERTLTYHIRETEAGLRIEQFLRRKGYSAQNLTQIKQMPESVLVNGSFCYLRHTLAAGDELLIHIQETESSRQILPVQLPLNIVYEDEDLIVVNKPAGMPIHPSLNNYTNSLANGLAWYYLQQGKPFIFRCCNRLDRDTSGLTVVAKHLVSASILSSMTKRKEVCREYLAVARGHVMPESGTITAPLARREGTIIERVVDWEKGEPAVTHYQVVTAKKRAQPGRPAPGDRPYPSDPDPYEISGLSADRRLSLQPGYGTHYPSGPALSPPVFPPSHHRGSHVL